MARNYVKMITLWLREASDVRENSYTDSGCLRILLLSRETESWILKDSSHSNRGPLSGQDSKGNMQGWAASLLQSPGHTSLN